MLLSYISKTNKILVMASSLTDDKWIVIKLGGTSQCKTGYDELAKLLVKNDPEQQKIKYVIVLSAISGVTDMLEKYTNTADDTYLDAAKEKEMTLRRQLGLEGGFDESMYKTNLFDMTDDDKLYEQSRIIGLGEFISTKILYEYLCILIGERTSICWTSSYDFVKSKNETFKLYPTSHFYGDVEKFNDISNYSEIVICQGFVASTPLGKTILLGRGGSDTSGAIIANMLCAIEYQVWTDVNGIYSCDPRIVKNSTKIMEIDYDLTVEIAEMGAKVMHPFSILPCAAKNIPIYIKNTFDMEKGITTIKKMDYRTETTPVVIAIQNNITLFKISSLNMWNSYGFMGDIFRRFSENKIDVNIVTSSPSSVYTTTDEKNINLLRSVTYDLTDKYQVNITRDCSIVTIVSPNVRKYANKINLDDINSHIIHFGANNLSLNFVVSANYAVELAKHLHDTIFSIL